MTAHRETAAPARDFRPHDVAAVRHDVRLDPAVPVRQLVRGHAAGAEARDLIAVIDASDADDVQLIRRIVQCAVQRPVVADGADHDDPVGDDLVDLLHERLLHKTQDSF